MFNPTWEMRRALRLAEKARAWTLPNPLVGAVLIRNEERIGEGYHQKFGGAHAEIEALNSCKDASGATLFVTLEPCCHTGKTPPCTQAIIRSGIKKVVIAVKDPSAKVSGKGIAELKAAGIEVELGLLEQEARDLNKEFFMFYEQGRPWITLKAALSLDGKIGFKGEETSLTGQSAQKQVHVLRNNHQAILVGSGTVLTDDPHLGVRLIPGRDPLRIILEGSRKISEKSKVFRDEHFLIIKEKKIEKIMQILREHEILSVLVEGGQEVFKTFLEAKLVDEVELFIAPKILGKKAMPFSELPQDFHVKQERKLGQDLWLSMSLVKAK